jgi:NSS family neurotransmitter:Na+ symporter
MEKKRNGFGSKLGFILASAGSAVGLGNIWGFPYKTGASGGAAFVLVYVLFALLLGIVGMTAEMYLGRRAAANPITAFRKIDNRLGAAGLLVIAIPFFIICYYAVLGGYTLRSAVSSFGDIGKSFADVSAGMDSFMANPWLSALCTFIFIALSVFIIMGGVQKGIEKASKVLMPVLFIILLAVMIYSLCLGEGVKDGLNFYILKADFAALGWDGVAAAMGQVFFSMSLGMGIMMVYGSYAGEEINLFRSAVQISIIDTVIALMAGFAIFPAAYHFMAVEGVSAETVGLGGFALMFYTLPQVFASLGVVGAIVGCFFFLMVAIAAVTSVVSLIEVVTQFVIQKFRISRKLAAVVPMLFAMAISVLVSLSLGGQFNVFGFDLLTFFDEMTNTVLMPVGALVACLCVGWGIPRAELAVGIESKYPVIGKSISLMTRYVTPVLIFAVEVFGVVQNVTKNTRYWAVIAAALLLVLIVCAIYGFFLRNKDSGCNADELIVDEKSKA